MTEHKLLSPCPFCGEKLFLDIDEGGGVAILHSLKEKDCFFPSILEIEMPVGTTLEQMIEKINRRPIQESFEHAIAEIEELGAQEAERKEFCPNCEAETPCTHEAELFVCDICGEDFAKYIVSRNCTLPDVSTTQDILTPIKTSQSNENTNPDYYKHDAVSWISIATRIQDKVFEIQDLKAELAELRERTRWIPVSERLPEEKQSVLALDRTGTAYHWEYSKCLSNIFVGYYTHWMPLPELPEEVK